MQNEMTPERIRFALELMGLMTFAVVVLAVCGAYVAKTAFKKTEEGGVKTLAVIVQRAGWLQLLTVQVVVMTMLILCVVGVVSGDSAVTLLSGIVGYVLGGYSRGQAPQISD